VASRRRQQRFVSAVCITSRCWRSGSWCVDGFGHDRRGATRGTLGLLFLTPLTPMGCAVRQDGGSTGGALTLWAGTFPVLQSLDHGRCAAGRLQPPPSAGLPAAGSLGRITGVIHHPQSNGAAGIALILSGLMLVGGREALLQIWLEIRFQSGGAGRSNDGHIHGPGGASEGSPDAERDHCRGTVPNS